MRETAIMTSLDEDLIIAVLRHLDDHKFRATMACVCKTWRACVKGSWDRVHFCFNDVETLRARIEWLLYHLSHPLLLQSLDLHSGMPSPTPFRNAGQCVFRIGDPDTKS